MADRLTCVYVTDRGFLPCTSFSILSLIKSASIPLDVHVLYVDDDLASLDKARSYLAASGATVTFDFLASDNLAGLSKPKSLPMSTYGRLAMHTVLPDERERLLYIDGDTLVDVDVAPLASLPLNGATIGAVVDIGRILVGRREEAQRRLQLGPDADYFNAGVLLIDWQAWRAERIGERALEGLIAEPARFVQADQCALNYVCRGRWQPLDFKWNYQPANVLYEDRERALFHFLGGRKPWDPRESRHPARFIARYQELLANSPWAPREPVRTSPLWVKDGLRLAHKALPRYWSKGTLYRSTVARISAKIGSAA